MPLAFTREPSPAIARCALTHLERAPIDPRLAAAQHEAYERALGNAGYDLVRLEALPDHPDGVFVEDTAILLGGHAIITRPGAPSRRDETVSTAHGLAPWFAIHQMKSGTLEGGDVLRVGDILYVGQSARTDAAGTAALTALVAPLGFRTVPVKLGPCLHLKTAVTLAGMGRDGRPVLLLNPDWVEPARFGSMELIEVARDEPFAANVVHAGDRLIMAAGSPRTAARLRNRGFLVLEIELGELRKAEAGGTCMSLLSGG